MTFETSYDMYAYKGQRKVKLSLSTPSRHVGGVEV